ncbi:PREDICTED: uncharacterized protein LOC109172879 [Ipomoea nil]|uniref:uncharacterized protein LOC109172879 n=1 Tax=Ipomoea nil TaxID=35883 RepID=UPI000901129B|nr:PREDICTED: uncharacterized protein LOC109172879 [Ipomoea nil]
MAADDDQDFSFPTTTDALLPPRFIESPPLWWTNSVASRRERLRKGGENGGKFDRTNSFSPLVSKKAYYVKRKSFSFVECGLTRRKIIEDDHSKDDDDEDDEDEEEEKMDMLWEDYFDEEMKRGNKVQVGISSSNNHHNLGPRGQNNKVECKCVRALKLSKASKMPSIVFLINLLKKVFLIHDSNNHPSFKKHSY